MVFTMQDMQPAAEPPETAIADEQRRIAKRHRVLKSAKIILNDWTAYDCQLRDMSATGARIRVGNSTEVPHKFRLYVAADGSIRDVTVAWKHHELIGVTFTSEAKPCALRKF
jgi:PilZ domain